MHRYQKVCNKSNRNAICLALGKGSAQLEVEAGGLQSSITGPLTPVMHSPEVHFSRVSS
jgi:hypothetical protein